MKRLWMCLVLMCVLLVPWTAGAETQQEFDLSCNRKTRTAADVYDFTKVTENWTIDQIVQSGKYVVARLPAGTYVRSIASGSDGWYSFEYWMNGTVQRGSARVELIDCVSVIRKEDGWAYLVHEQDPDYAAKIQEGTLEFDVTQYYNRMDYAAYAAGLAAEPERKDGQPSAAARSDASQSTTMYVFTGNSGKLNLRKGKSTDSGLLGRYKNGTAVQVTGFSGDWARVQVGGKSGYMMRQYLTYDAPQTKQAEAPAAQSTATGGTVMYVKTGNTGRLHLRAEGTSNSKSLGLYKNGTAVTVVSVSGTWAQVQVNGKTGYMKLKFLAEKP